MGGRSASRAGYADRGVRASAPALLAFALLLSAASTAVAQSAAGVAAPPIWPMPIMPPHQPMVPPYVPPPPPPTLVYPNLPVPSAGALLVASQSAPVVSVASNATGMLIPGTLSPVGRFWVWKPYPAFDPGTYTVTLIGPPGPNMTGQMQSYVVTAVDEPIRVPALTTSGIALSTQRTLGTPVCCQHLPQYAGPANCFASEATVRAQLTATLAQTDAGASASQFLFAVHAQGTSPPMFMPFAPVGVFFSEQAEQYCFEVLALDINTQRTERYDELAPRCAPHGGLEPLGVQSNAGADVALASRSTCPLPPEGFAPRWCTLNEAACTTQPNAIGCQAYGHVCRGEPLPMAMPVPVAMAMATDAAGAAGGAATNGASGSGANLAVMAGAGADPQVAGSPGGQSRRFGCSIARHRSTAAAWLAPLAIAGMAVARRVRRRQ